MPSSSDGPYAVVSSFESPDLRPTSTQAALNSATIATTNVNTGFPSHCTHQFRAFRRGAKQPTPTRGTSFSGILHELALTRTCQINRKSSLPLRSRTHTRSLPGVTGSGRAGESWCKILPASCPDTLPASLCAHHDHHAFDLLQPQSSAHNLPAKTVERKGPVIQDQISVMESTSNKSFRLLGAKSVRTGRQRTNQLHLPTRLSSHRNSILVRTARPGRLGYVASSPRRARFR